VQIFKCSLDDLTNDEIKDIGEITKPKNNISNIIDELLELINRTFNMFKNMKFKDIIKLIFQMGLVTIILLLFHLPVEYLYGLCRNIFMNFGTTFGNILSGILNLTLNICYLIIFVIIFVYIYKIRFLDKYNTSESIIKDKGAKTSEEKEEVNTVINEVNNKPKKQHVYAFFNILGSLFIGFIKFFVVCMTIPFIFSLLMLFACLILCIILIFKNVFYLSVLLGIISAITINIILLIIAFYFIFNKKIDVKKIFITSICSIALLGISIGIGVYDIANFKYIDDVPKNENITTINNEFDMNNERIIYFHTYSNDINYIVDETLNNKIIIKTEFYKNYYNINVSELDDKSIIISNNSLKEIEPMKIVNMVINDLSNKEFHNYNKLSNIKINIYSSKENIQKIRSNISKHSEREYCDNFRKDIYGYQQKIDNLQNQLFELENENSNLKTEIEQHKMTIQEYKDNIKGLLEN